MPVIADNLMDDEETPEVVPYFADEMSDAEEEPTIRRQDIEHEHDKKITAINSEQKEKRQEMVKHKQIIMSDRVIKTTPENKASKQHEIQVKMHTKQPLQPLLVSRSRLINDQKDEESSNPFEPVIP